MENEIQKSTIDFGEGDTSLKECLDCGAYALGKNEIVHYKSCVAGEANHWVEYYEQNTRAN